MKRASCGLDAIIPIEICRTLKLASENGYEFVCVPLVHPRFKREFIGKCKNRKGPFTRPDLVLKSSEWNALVAGKISPYLDMDLVYPSDQAKFVLEQELNYGNHLDVPAIVISLHSSNCFNLARIINSNLSGLKPYQVWVEIPMISKRVEASVWRSDVTEVETESTWEWWNRFSTLCDSDKRLGIILEITKTLPQQEELNKWIGEPIKCLALSTSIFLTNKKGYPVLSKPLQIYLKSLVPLDIQVIIKGNNHHFGFDCYQKYINHLWQEASVQQNSKLEDICRPENSLQYLLQPMADNGVSKSYEIFEKDIVKYQQYIHAVYSALLDRVTDDEKESTVVNIMVVSAGRGPLVTAALEAASKASRRVKIYAVEMNPHAVVTLQSYQEELWGESVEIISGDIRQLNFPKQIDILLSELIGSFGDNELSPEILDAAQNFLKDGGISIPESYMSYICPAQCSSVYKDLKSSNEKCDYEIPYVLLHKSKYYISKPKPLFSFHHPHYSNSIDNSRYKQLHFKVEQSCILHGFVGFFETVLYKELKLSIIPETHTPGLISWFPIFFPLFEPVRLEAGNEIEVNFWRLVSDISIWYEWTITKPIPLPIHNTNGRSSKIKLV